MVPLTEEISQEIIRDSALFSVESPHKMQERNKEIKEELLNKME